MTGEPGDGTRGGPADKLTDHLANERTYHAWLRTGIAQRSDSGSSSLDSG
jgi:uncharacterized membrane protein YidH (DUF202 family)